MSNAHTDAIVKRLYERIHELKKARKNLQESVDILEEEVREISNAKSQLRRDAKDHVENNENLRAMNAKLRENNGDLTAKCKALVVKLDQESSNNSWLSGQLQVNKKKTREVVEALEKRNTQLLDEICEQDEKIECLKKNITSLKGDVRFRVEEEERLLDLFKAIRCKKDRLTETLANISEKPHSEDENFKDLVKKNFNLATEVLRLHEVCHKGENLIKALRDKINAFMPGPSDFAPKPNFINRPNS